MNIPSKVLLGVVAGVVVWGLLWVGGNQLAMMAWPGHLVEGLRVTHLPLLIGMIAYSVLLSVLAGHTTARIVKKPAAFAVQLLAAVQLGIGLYFQSSVWELMPLWYHLIFLGLVIPATIAGGWLSTKGWGRK